MPPGSNTWPAALMRASRTALLKPQVTFHWLPSQTRSVVVLAWGLEAPEMLMPLPSSFWPAVLTRDPMTAMVKLGCCCSQTM